MGDSEATDTGMQPASRSDDGPHTHYRIRCSVRLTDVTFGQAIRFLSISGQEGGRVYGANLIRALEERYGFWESPKTVADYDMAKGVNFLHGFFNRRFVIDRLQIYANGIVAEAKMPTEALDDFLDDIIQWARSEINLGVNDSQNRRAYNSHIEIFSDMPFSKVFLPFASVGEHLTSMMRAYGVNTNTFEFSGIRLNANNDTLPAPKPVAFSFERREGKPYDSGFFFSTASLKTSDHMSILNELEAIIRAMLNAS